MMQSHLTPRQFAEAIGVSESSVRRWADAGQIRMSRTGGGHRKITRAEAIRFIRATSAEVIRPDLLQVDEPGHRQRRPAAFGAQHDELFRALSRGDSEVAFALLTRMYVNGVSVAEICDGPLRHAMQEIGRLWPADKRGILVEHRATSICIEALNRLRGNFTKPPATGVVAVGGAPANDPYLLPSLMVSTVLADVGYRVVNLGPNTPLDVISQSANELAPKLAWISFTASVPKQKLETLLEKISKQLGRKKVHLAIGGQSAAKIHVPIGKFVHAFGSLTEMAGFAKTLLSQ
jgi:excisionase family DNA binding protein